MPNITITIGQIPGKPARELELNEGATLSDAISKSGLSTSGYEIRINNVKTTDMSATLADDDFVTLVQSLKGNARGESFVKIICHTFVNGEKKMEKIAPVCGSFITEAKKLLSLNGKFDDFDWWLDGVQIKNKDTEITESAKELYVTEKKGSNEIHVIFNDCDLGTMNIPKRARIAAVMLRVAPSLEFKDFSRVLVNNSPVKFGFHEVKSEATVVLSTLETTSAETPCEDAPIAKTSSEKESKSKAQDKKKIKSSNKNVAFGKENISAKDSVESTNVKAPETIDVKDVEDEQADYQNIEPTEPICDSKKIEAECHKICCKNLREILNAAESGDIILTGIEKHSSLGCYGEAFTENLYFNISSKSKEIK